MSAHFPRIRHRGIPPVRRTLEDGAPSHLRRQLLARDVFRIAFYLPHDHPDIASGVSHAIDSYMRAVGQGPATINHVYIDDDEGDSLSEARWSYVRRLLRPERKFRFVEEYGEESAYRAEKRGYDLQFVFDGGFRSTNGYQLHYRARLPWRTPSPDSVSLLSATLPTEYLEVHGPVRVRELALDMASQLRFASGHAGLALRLYWPLRTANDAMRAELSRYPGIDLRPAWLDAERMGGRVDGVHWLNLLAQPVLGQIGGVTVLRSLLRAPETAVSEFDEGRVVIALGEWPDAGDMAAGRILPSYRELSRVLEPWLEPLHLSQETWSVEPPRYTSMRFTEEEARRWWRRFLD